MIGYCSRTSRRCGKPARIKVPLLVVHGELDTNVPLNEAQAGRGRRARAGGEVEYLELAGEGHEYRSRAARLMLVDRLVGFLRDQLQAGPTHASPG